MKRLLILLLMLSPASVAFSQDKQAILQLLETQRQAWNKGDLEGYMQGYWQSDSLLFVGSAGPTYGWHATLQKYKKSYPNKAAMGLLSFDIREVRSLSPSYAFVLGGWHLKRDKDELGGFFTLVFRQIGGQWKIVADHSS